jgi:serine/threonine protein kinase
MVRPDDPTVEHGATSAAAAPLVRGTSVGRYLLLDLLGEGGMGVVYKAYDPELGRPIALKLLQTAEEASARLRDRLLREAQALARLSHPNVIAVHDVGTFQDRVFIAMEYVEGQTLRAWLKAQPRSRPEILSMFLAAGEGLSAAHRAGLIHRDFKPDNVMVGGDGRVRVLDFGLARAATASSTHSGVSEPSGPASGESSSPSSASLPTDGGIVTVESSSRHRRSPPAVMPPSPSASESSGHRTPQLLDTPLTHVGAIVGTPRFMAPEQHLDGVVGEAADQFSFCVSLYWALYKAFPFDEVDGAVQGKLAEPPAGATVPRWLRQVLTRGLRAKQEERYPSMSALLDALRADPAEARRRRLRGALGLIAAAAVASTTVAGGLAYRARRGAADQARLAQEFGQEVEQISAIARYAAYMPLHDTHREVDEIRARMASLKERMLALGPLATGPGHHALGRGYLALERYDEALSELDAAWNSGYRTPAVAFALGLAHGQLYQRALADLRKGSDPTLDAQRRDQIARAHRDPALRYLKLAKERSSGSSLEAPEHVEGLIALYEQRFDDALALARKAGERVSWWFEADTLQGDVHRMAGKDRFWKGDVDGAREDYRRAEEAYRKVIEVARSSFAARMGDCGLQADTLDLEVKQGHSPEATLKKTVASCSAAATTRPDEAAPLMFQASAWRMMGVYQLEHGSSPVAPEQTAIHLAEEALTRDPRAVRAHVVIGGADWDLADYYKTTGGDPRPALAEAIGHSRRALELDPTSVEAYGNLEDAYEIQGEYEIKRGVDPHASLRSTIEYAGKELQLSSGNFVTWNRLGTANLATARWERDHGGVATPAFQEAERSFEKVIQLSPNLDYGYTNLCSLHHEWAELQLLRGEDPQRGLANGAERCEQAIRLDSEDGISHLNLGLTNLELATWQVEQHANPGDALARARAALARASQVFGEDSETKLALARAQLLEGRWLATVGRDPRPAFSTARDLANKALAMSRGKEPEVLYTLAQIHRWHAEWRAARKLSVADQVREGLSLTTRLEGNPDHAGLTETAGILYLISARMASGPARSEAASAARQALARALQLNGNLEREIRSLVDEATRLGR